MKLSVRRQPLSDHSYFAEKTYEATVFVDRLMDDSQRWLSLNFATNPDGERVSVFDIAISPMHFVELARMMVEADPGAAINAFGAALQTAEVERRAPIKAAEAA